MDRLVYDEKNDLSLKALHFLIKTFQSKGFFQFEIIINVLVSTFRLIWISRFLFYAHKKNILLVGLQTYTKTKKEMGKFNFIKIKFSHDFVNWWALMS